MYKRFSLLSVVFLAFVLFMAVTPVMGEENGDSTATIAEPAVNGDKPWSVGVHCSNRSSFKLFGSLASDGPVCGASVSYGTNGWDLALHATEEVGDHDPSIVFGSYYGAVLTKEKEIGRWTWNGGVEYFHSDARSSHAFTLVAPLASVAYRATRDLDITVGGQYLAPHNTPWDGERAYGYLDFKYEKDVGRWALGGSVGGVLGNEGRQTLYVEPKAKFNFAADASLFGSALWAQTDDTIDATVPWTVTLGGSVDF